MTESLENIRSKIDTIDNNVHDLLMERAALVASVAAAKKKDGLQIVQPAREARMMRRLLARHDGPLPQATIIRIWRELVGSVSLLQSGLSAVVISEGDPQEIWDMAKNYFGSAIPMSRASSFEDVKSDMLEGGVSFAVLPWPDKDKTWWTGFREEEDLSVICALPYALHPQAGLSSRKALIVSKIEFMSSDDDKSFVLVSFKGGTQEDAVRKAAEDAQFTVTDLYQSDRTDFLLEVEGFFERGIEPAGDIRKNLGESCDYAAVIGGYPVIPDIT